MHVKSHLWIAVVVLGSIVVGACAGPSGQAAAAFPAGVYKPAQKLYADELTLGEDGRYQITVGTWQIHGSYAVDGTKIVLTNEDTAECRDYPGTYGWEARGNELTLKAIEDTCTGSDREKDLSRSWVLQP